MASANYSDITGRVIGHWSGGGGGGSQPLSEQCGQTANLTLADGASAQFGLQHAAGDVLLDYSDPLNPAVISAGVYAITARGVCFDGTQPGGNWNMGAFLNGSVISTSAFSDGPLSGGAIGVAGPTLTAVAIGPLSAGDTLFIAIANYRGSPGNLTFSLAGATVVKIP